MRAADDDRGQATLELALSLPVLVALFAALIEIALLASDQVRVWHAAREAARAAVVDPDTTAAEIAAARVGLEPLELRIEPEPPYRVQGDPLTVEVSHRPNGHVPLIGAITRVLTLEARATMRIEQP